MCIPSKHLTCTNLKLTFARFTPCLKRSKYLGIAVNGNLAALANTHILFLLVSYMKSFDTMTWNFDVTLCVIMQQCLFQIFLWPWWCTVWWRCPTWVVWKLDSVPLRLFRWKEMCCHLQTRISFQILPVPGGSLFCVHWWWYFVN